MRCTKNDFWFCEGGRVWACDKYSCENCGAEVLTGFAREPITSQHENTYEDALDHTGLTVLE